MSSTDPAPGGSIAPASSRSTPATGAATAACAARPDGRSRLSRTSKMPCAWPFARGTLKRPDRDGGRAPFRPVDGLPHGARVVFRADGAGRCVFLETDGGRLCGVHRQLGPDALASACRDFPRIVTLTPAGYSITLSHYCPTAAAHLFRDDASLSIEINPPAFPPDWPYEGLDARDSVGPLLRPGVMMGWEAHFRWESHVVETLARTDLGPSTSRGAPGGPGRGRPGVDPRARALRGPPRTQHRRDPGACRGGDAVGGGVRPSVAAGGGVRSVGAPAPLGSPARPNPRTSGPAPGRSPAGWRRGPSPAGSPCRAKACALRSWASASPWRFSGPRPAGGRTSATRVSGAWTPPPSSRLSGVPTCCSSTSWIR